MKGKENELDSLQCSADTDRRSVVLQLPRDARVGLPHLPTGRRRLLVACDQMVLAGGLLRFDKVAQALRPWGHEMTFVPLRKDFVTSAKFGTPIVSLDEAKQRRWDAVMIPGAGFPDDCIRQFSLFRDESFGVRMQHILNDQSRREAFKAVNTAFAPHVVVFNNEHWPPGSYTDFMADQFHTLLGAVDTRMFRPRPYRSHPLRGGRWIVGGLANKNPEPLLDMLDDVPAGLSIRLFGNDSRNLKDRYQRHVTSGRLELAGPLFGDDLSRFYRDVDCIAMTETRAGWANMVAEAMASGVPVVCTSHGTLAIARHEETALVVAEPTSQMLASAVLRLRDDPDLCQAMAERAREAVEPFSWEAYARDLLRLAQQPEVPHSVCAPDLGLYGKWLPESRLDGLHPLLKLAKGLSVVDLGAADGLVGRAFLEHGASVLHGFEREAQRVEMARGLCGAWKEAAFRVADLSDWDAFVGANTGSLKSRYDVALHLGLHKHLPDRSRLAVLRGVARLARRHLAFRAPLALYELDGVDTVLRSEGFALRPAVESVDRMAGEDHCWLYDRIQEPETAT